MGDLWANALSFLSLFRPNNPTSPLEVGVRLPQPADLNPAAPTPPRDLFVIVNPAARQGRLPDLVRDTQASLSTSPYQVHIYPTAETAVARQAQYAELSARVLAGRGARVVSISGDGTACGFLAEFLRDFDRTEAVGASPAERNAVLWERYGGLTTSRAGSADDFSTQLNGPPNPSADPQALPRHLSRAVRVPWTPMLVSGEGLEPTYVFEAVGTPTDADMFERGLALRNANRQSVLSRGIVPFVRALPDSIEAWGIEGVDVEITVNGVKHPRFRTSQIEATQGRALAGAGAIPGQQGDLFILGFPAGSRGYNVMAESVLRRIVTQFSGRSIDLVGSRQGLASIAPEAQSQIGPSDHVRVEIFDPRTGERLPAPWHTEGDARPQRTSWIEIEGTSLRPPFLAAPDSDAAIRYGQRALAEGHYLDRPANPNQPLDPVLNPEYAQSLRELPIAAAVRPPASQTVEGAVRVTSASYPSPGFSQWMRDLNLEPSRAPAVVAMAHGVNQSEGITSIFEQPRSLCDLQAWSAGQTGISNENTLWYNGFRNRLETAGPGFAGGLVGAWGANYLMARQGITAETHPLGHFGVSTVSAYAGANFASAVATPIINQARGFPYHLARVVPTTSSREVTQVVYENFPTLWRAIRASVSEAFDIRPLIQSVVVNGENVSTGARVLNAMTAPVRLAMVLGRSLENMGPALALGRMSDSILRHTTSLDANERSIAATAGMLTPIGARFFAPRLAAALSSVAAKRIGIAFLATYAADLVFTSGHILYYGEQSATMRRHNREVSDHQLGEDGFFSLHNLGYIFCPEITAALVAD